MFYAKSTGGFYDSAIHGDNMPADVVEITTAAHAELLAGQSHGMQITCGEDGYPFLANPPAPVPLTRGQIEASRLRAYADPITGSDRYFAESSRESLLGNTEAAEAAKALGLARFAEIQAEYPWPAE